MMSCYTENVKDKNGIAYESIYRRSNVYWFLKTEVYKIRQLPGMFTRGQNPRPSRDRDVQNRL